LWVFGLINFLNFAKIFQKLGSKNKLKDSGKMRHLLMFSTTREEVVGDLFPLKGSGTLISLKMIIL
jgi:hypothetical protein